MNWLSENLAGIAKRLMPTKPLQLSTDTGLACWITIIYRSFFFGNIYAG